MAIPVPSISIPLNKRVLRLGGVFALSADSVIFAYEEVGQSLEASIFISMFKIKGVPGDTPNIDEVLKAFRLEELVKLKVVDLKVREYIAKYPFLYRLFL